MLSFVKSSKPAMYAMIARTKFAMSAHPIIHAMCHSVTSVNLYSPCLLETLSVFASTSNCSTPSHRKKPFVNRTSSSGSHIIGIGFLKWKSFLNPNRYHVHSFVLTLVSK